MAEIKFTKNALRDQEKKLEQLRKYLPVLQLKKAMLQEEVAIAKGEIHSLEEKQTKCVDKIEGIKKLLEAYDFSKTALIAEVRKRTENIAGVEVPYLEELLFEPFTYDLLDSPPWLESVILKIRLRETINKTLELADEKRKALEKECREVTLRVNLFEKRLIPEAISHIKKIKVFLGDQELAAVGRAKVAKAKIAMRKNLCASM